jgi:hypothetical protein
MGSNWKATVPREGEWYAQVTLLPGREPRYGQESRSVPEPIWALSRREKPLVPTENRPLVPLPFSPLPVVIPTVLSRLLISEYDLI